jgi:hypothetical protein
MISSFPKGEEVIKPDTCKDCKFYKPISETQGNCFGHEVPADMPAENCPKKAFQPRK